MRKIMLSAIFMFSLMVSAFPAEFQARIADYPETVLQGTPGYVTAEVKNTSGGPITVAWGAGCDPKGSFLVRRADGRQRRECVDPEQVLRSNRYTLKSLPNDWVQSRTENAFMLCHDDPGEYIVQYVLSFCRPGVSGEPENKAWVGTIKSNEIHIHVLAPTGVDLEAFKAFKGQPFAKKEDLLEKYPTSTYAGWVLKDWPEVPGVFVKNESATKTIFAAIKRSEEDLHRYWRLDVPLPEDQKVRDRKVVMRQFVESCEAFVNAHSDISFSGWILARAGFNALGLGDFRTACVDLKRALELDWKLPGASKNAEPSYKEGTTYALELLQKHGHCKKD